MNYHNRQSMLRAAVFSAVIVLLAGSLSAQDDMEAYGPQPTGAPEAQRRHDVALSAHEGKAHMLVLPGLVADRQARTIEILAESTGVSGGEVAEFLLIDRGSSHGYEALLWSHARPSDVHRALEFIGLKPSTPRNPAVPRLWADGDQVTLSLSMQGDDERIPIERLIVDVETETTLPEKGFVFGGSRRVTPRDKPGASIYVADQYDPRAIASLFSHPGAVLDVPGEVTQGEVYGNQVISDEYDFVSGQLLTVVLTPRAGADQSPPRELLLALAPDSGTNAVTFSLREPDGAVLATGPALTAVLEQLASERKEGVRTIVELAFDETVPLEQVAKTCVLMAMMENMGMLQVKPPVAGQLYHRAFVPDKGWRDPAGRPTQPWELHVSRTEGKPVAELVWQEVIWSEENITPDFKRHAFKVSDPEAMRLRLEQEAQKRSASGVADLPSVLLVFGDGKLSYGDLLAFTRPVLATHGTVYVFMEAL
jgi:hypothetical protein